MADKTGNKRIIECDLKAEFWDKMRNLVKIGQRQGLDIDLKESSGTLSRKFTISGNKKDVKIFNNSLQKIYVKPNMGK